MSYPNYPQQMQPMQMQQYAPQGYPPQQMQQMRPPGYPPQGYPQMQKVVHSRSRLWLYGLIIVVILAAAYYFYSSSKSATPVPPASTPAPTPSAEKAAFVVHRELNKHRDGFATPRKNMPWFFRH
jgi:hypothetical protein